VGGVPCDQSDVWNIFRRNAADKRFLTCELSFMKRCACTGGELAQRLSPTVADPSLTKFGNQRRMIGRPFPGAWLNVDPSVNTALGQGFSSPHMIDPQA
jgi:hypothetical protein